MFAVVIPPCTLFTGVPIVTLLLTKFICCFKLRVKSLTPLRNQFSYHRFVQSSLIASANCVYLHHSWYRLSQFLNSLVCYSVNRIEKQSSLLEGGSNLLKALWIIRNELWNVSGQAKEKDGTVALGLASYLAGLTSICLGSDVLYGSDFSLSLSPRAICAIYNSKLEWGTRRIPDVLLTFLVRNPLQILCDSSFGKSSLDDTSYWWCKMGWPLRDQRVCDTEHHAIMCKDLSWNHVQVMFIRYEHACCMYICGQTWPFYSNCPMPLIWRPLQGQF